MTTTIFHRALRWLVREWPYAGALAAAFLLAIVPIWLDAWGLPLTLVYVQLPAYLLHQLEEHAGDRFRMYFNRRVGGGREALTPIAVFWINSLGVWVVNLLATYLAWCVDLALGLIAVYLTVINGLIHVIMAIALREYNPGLATALALFLPLGAWAAVDVSRASHASVFDHALAISIGIAVHAGIVVHVRLRLKRLSEASSRATHPGSIDDSRDADSPQA